MNLFKFFLLFIFLTFNLYALGMGGGGGGSDDGGGDATKQFDTWDYWIGDDKNLPDSEDRTISTKIAGKAFQISLASIDSKDTKYENKKKDGAANKDFSVEIAAFINDQNIKTKVSNTIYFDPTSDDDKYIQKSDPLTVENAYKDLVIGIRMCATYDEDKEEYVIYELSECSGSDKGCTDDSDSEEFKMCYATDNFSVRPKLFNITDKTEPLKAGEDQGYDVIAEDENGDATPKYTLPEDNTDGDVVAIVSKVMSFFSSGGDDTGDEEYDLNLSVIKYMPDGSENSDLYGEGHIVEYTFKDGDATGDDRNVTIDYNEVGKVTLIPKDLNWTNVDYDDTDDNCNNGTDDNGDDNPEKVGRFICGDTDATFIPSYFLISDLKLYDHNDSTFTYISEDSNMSAHLSLNLEAKNFDDDTTKNFDVASWENNITVSFSLDNETDINKNSAGSDILKIGFDEGNKSIVLGDDNSTTNLRFNYKRVVKEAINPFRIDISDMNITVLSIYPDNNKITDSNGADIEGEGNVTFVYGRTNAPRTRFVDSDEYNVTIYYEAFCSGTDKYDNDCDKSLLADGENSTISDDPRWFINTKHNHTDKLFGSAKNISQKRGTGVDVDSEPTGDHQDSVILKYSGKFPYKTTMQNEASSWLIYKKYDATATTNEFEVEFNKKSGSTSWAGVSEEGVSNTDVVDTTTRTNRRTMW
ncbi:MAG: hypothetical protein U9P38_09045 [Campylobacterota bacterium]|nr:hypothetical protein [Campylobacterota bacterium]